MARRKLRAERGDRFILGDPPAERLRAIDGPSEANGLSLIGVFEVSCGEYDVTSMGKAGELDVLAMAALLSYSSSAVPKTASLGAAPARSPSEAVGLLALHNSAVPITADRTEAMNTAILLAAKSTSVGNA